MTLRTALLFAPSWAVMLGREKMRMMERSWSREATSSAGR